MLLPGQIGIKLVYLYTLFVGNCIPPLSPSWCRDDCVSSFFLIKKDVRYSPWIGLSAISIFQTNIIFLGRNYSSNSFFVLSLFQESQSVQPVVPVLSGWALQLRVLWDADDTCLRMASLPAKHWTMTCWSSSRSWSGSRLQAVTMWSSHRLWAQTGSHG